MAAGKIADTAHLHRKIFFEMAKEYYRCCTTHLCCSRTLQTARSATSYRCSAHKYPMRHYKPIYQTQNQHLQQKQNAPQGYELSAVLHG